MNVATWKSESNNQVNSKSVVLDQRTWAQGTSGEGMLSTPGAGMSSCLRAPRVLLPTLLGAQPHANRTTAQERDQQPVPCPTMSLERRLPLLSVSLECLQRSASQPPPQQLTHSPGTLRAKMLVTTPEGSSCHYLQRGSKLPRI